MSVGSSSFFVRFPYMRTVERSPIPENRLRGSRVQRITGEDAAPAHVVHHLGPREAVVPAAPLGIAQDREEAKAEAPERDRNREQPLDRALDPWLAWFQADRHETHSRRLPGEDPERDDDQGTHQDRDDREDR